MDGYTEETSWKHLLTMLAMLQDCVAIEAYPPRSNNNLTDDGEALPRKFRTGVLTTDCCASYVSTLNTVPHAMSTKPYVIDPTLS